MFSKDKVSETLTNSLSTDNLFANNSHKLIISNLSDKLLSRLTTGFILTCMFLFITTLNIYPQMTSGGFAASYLQRHAGVRAASMSGAFTAISNDATAVFYNPAGISFLSSKPTINSSVSMIGLGQTHSTIAWAQRIHPRIGIGIGINSLNSGGFQGRDVQGNTTTMLQDWQYSMFLSAAYRLESVSVGATVKYLKHNLLGSNIYSTGTAVDLGAKFDIFNMFSVGIAVQNFGSQVFWSEATPGDGSLNEALPYNVRAGIAMEFGLNDEYITQRSPKTGKLETIYLPPTQYILVDFDAVMYQFDENPRLMMGAEAVIDDRLALRAGLTIWGEDLGMEKLFPFNNWGTGISIRPDIAGFPFRTVIDYSVNRELINTSGISHNIGLTLEF